MAYTANAKTDKNMRATTTRKIAPTTWSSLALILRRADHRAIVAALQGVADDDAERAWFAV
jgi:hypothetical protein